MPLYQSTKTLLIVIGWVGAIDSESVVFGFGLNFVTIVILPGTVTVVLLIIRAALIL